MTTGVFADTSFFVAFLNPSDHLHVLARRFMINRPGRLVTTSWIVVELGNYVCKTTQRTRFVSFVAALRSDPMIDIVPADEDLLSEGLALDARRSDKEWSVTDCISFVVMSRHGLTEALTADRHFDQAGFNALMR